MGLEPTTFWKASTLSPEAKCTTETKIGFASLSQSKFLEQNLWKKKHDIKLKSAGIQTQTLVFTAPGHNDTLSFQNSSLASLSSRNAKSDY